MKSNKVLMTSSAVLLTGCAAAIWWAEVLPRIAGGGGHSFEKTSPSSLRSPEVAGIDTEKLSALMKSSNDLPGAGDRFKEVVEAGGPEINKAMEELLPLWVVKDPEGALAYADTLPTGPLRDSLLHRMVQLWSERDLNTSLTWIAARSPAEKESLLLSVCKQAALKNERTAVFMAKDQGLVQANPEFVAELVGQWAKKDQSSALVWARSQADQETRSAFLTQVALSQAGASKYKEAVLLVLKEIPQGQQQDDAMIMIVNQWSQKDVKAATAWVESSFPLNNPLRGRAFAEVEAARQGQQLLFQAMK
jgi:hypothetical protein